MFKFTLLAAAAVAVATPAFAAEPKLAEPTASEMPAPASSPAARSTSTQQQYCIVQQSTASIIDRKVCRTRSQWLKDGFDPLAGK